MSPETICVTLSTARALKEAGWTRETVFWWRYYNGTQQWAVRLLKLPEPDQGDIPAPTLAEIMQELPVNTTFRRTPGQLYVASLRGYESQYADSPKEAAAQLWIKLQEVKP